MGWIVGKDEWAEDGVMSGLSRGKGVEWVERGWVDWVGGRMSRLGRCRGD